MISWKKLISPPGKAPKDIKEWLGLITDTIKKLKGSENWYDDVTLLTSDSIINDLDTGGVNKMLSSEQGKILNQKVTNLGTQMDNIVYGIDENIVKVINIERYDINKHGENALATTKGLNEVFSNCKRTENVIIKIPRGIYFIDKNSSVNIKNLQNVTIDFSNSLLIKESNNSPKYEVLQLDSCKNVNVKNLNIIGDRDGHDFSSGGTHEWGSGLALVGWCDGVVIKNVNCSNCTGDGISLSSSLYNLYNQINYTDLESGGINTDGSSVDNSLFTRLNKFLSIPTLSESNRYISVMGDGYGGYKGGLVLDDVNFTFIFYNSDETVVYSKTIKPYDAIWLKDLPSNAVKYKFYFTNSISNILNESNLFTIRGSSFVNNITIDNCKIDNNRRLGIAVCGAQNVTIKNNEITGTNGTNPQFGIDIEDGYNLNQNISIFNNIITRNKQGGLVAVSAKGVMCYSNKIDGAISLGGERGYNYKVFNNIGQNSVSIKENFGSYIKQPVIEDFLSTSSPISIGSNVTYRNSNFYSGIILSALGDLKFNVVFENCKFDISDYTFAFIVRRGNIRFENCTFNLSNVRPFFRNEISETIEFLEIINCKFNIQQSDLGSITNVKNILITGTQFHVKPPYTAEGQFGSDKYTENITIEDCTWNILSYTLKAKYVKFNNNNFIRNSENITPIWGPNRYYGVAIEALQLLTFKNNIISILNAEAFPNNQLFLNLRSDGLIIYNDNILDLDKQSPLKIKFSELSKCVKISANKNIYFYNVNTIISDNVTFLNAEYYTVLNS